MLRACVPSFHCSRNLSFLYFLYQRRKASLPEGCFSLHIRSAAECQSQPKHTFCGECDGRCPAEFRSRLPTCCGRWLVAPICRISSRCWLISALIAGAICRRGPLSADGEPPAASPVQVAPLKGPPLPAQAALLWRSRRRLRQPGPSCFCPYYRQPFGCTAARKCSVPIVVRRWRGTCVLIWLHASGPAEQNINWARHGNQHCFRVFQVIVLGP